MDDEAKIAACLICTLAPVMRDCKHCAFRLGLAVKALELPALKPSPEVREAYIALVNANPKLSPA